MKSNCAIFTHLVTSGWSVRGNGESEVAMKPKYEKCPDPKHKQPCPLPYSSHFSKVSAAIEETAKQAKTPVSRSPIFGRMKTLHELDDED